MTITKYKINDIVMIDDRRAVNKMIVRDILVGEKTNYAIYHSGHDTLLSIDAVTFDGITKLIGRHNELPEDLFEL